MTVATLDRETLERESADWVLRAEELSQSLLSPPPAISPQERLRAAAKDVEMASGKMTLEAPSRAAELRSEASMFRAAAALLDGAPDSLPAMRDRLTKLGDALKREEDAPRPSDRARDLVDDVESWMDKTLNHEYREDQVLDVLWYARATRDRAEAALIGIEKIYATSADERTLREAEEMAAKALFCAERAAAHALENSPTPS